MSVSAIGYTPSAKKSLDENVQLTQQDFLKIMVENLKQQDPFKPQEGTDYYKDIMTMSTYQSTLAMEKNTEKLVNVQSKDIIGKTVSFYSPADDGAVRTGVVDKMNFDKDGSYCTVGSQTFDVGYIFAVEQTPVTP